MRWNAVETTKRRVVVRLVVEPKEQIKRFGFGRDLGTRRCGPVPLSNSITLFSSFTAGGTVYPTHGQVELEAAVLPHVAGIFTVNGNRPHWPSVAFIEQNATDGFAVIHHGCGCQFLAWFVTFHSFEDMHRPQVSTELFHAHAGVLPFEGANGSWHRSLQA